MKTNAAFGTTLTRAQLKSIKGGVGVDDPSCLVLYTYACGANVDCCSGNCARNQTDTGTICMPEN
jgi:predicted lipoprotein with Yx(FWY)xxD motif